MGHQRRDSSVLAQTPRVRPASLASSDSGTDPSRERKPSAENHTKISALGQSTRLNTSATAVATSSKPVRTVVGSMGPPPPPLRPRASIVGTAPTPAQRTLTRSSSARVISAAPQSQVKTKVTVSKPAASGSRPAEQQDEKENGTEITKTRRLSKIPTLAQ
ncbi:hypothetical protein C8J57DRAFT_1286546 [Mycena rebaudengoi]|nr:hypothetical protein C8J57DRAFT_1286546 [Mycena rebaudengoi]